MLRVRRCSASLQHCTCCSCTPPWIFTACAASFGQGLPSQNYRIALLRLREGVIQLRIPQLPSRSARAQTLGETDAGCKSWPMLFDLRLSGMRYNPNRLRSAR
eukprot:1177866-Rhodomonas_salina.1